MPKNPTPKNKKAQSLKNDRKGKSKKRASPERVAGDSDEDVPEEFVTALKPDNNGKISPERNEWTSKIGNHLKKMVKTITEYNKEMGKTGTGLKSAQEIRAGTELANKWEEIREKCPWYFRMKEIIGGRPTAEPAGLGNASTTPDLSILSTTSSASCQPLSVSPSNDNNSLADDTLTGISEIDLSDGLGGDTESEPNVTTPAPDDNPPVPPKQKADDENVEGNPPSAPTQPPAKKTKLSEFAVLAEAEEATRQAELAVEQAKVEALAKFKIEQRRQQSLDKKVALEHDLAKMKLKMEYKLRMKQASLQSQQFSFGGSTSFGDTSSSMAMSQDIPNNFHDSNFTNNFPLATDDYNTLHLPGNSTTTPQVD
ncbi:hypothetical protein BJ165DRAFT_1534926 [Panaeolus papilionaceus]|nr:hypothetical protein BJ165DRAFT_1534926 [Panaeolus papilionaceus]